MTFLSCQFKRAISAYNGIFLAQIVIITVVPYRNPGGPAGSYPDEKEGIVEKVAIIEGDSEDVAVLRACIRMLFPECEVQILPRRHEGFGDALSYTEPARVEN